MHKKIAQFLFKQLVVFNKVNNVLKVDVFSVTEKWSLPWKKPSRSLLFYINVSFD